MMNFNSISAIKKNGFKGFKTVQELWSNRESIPKEKGVYLIIDADPEHAEFLSQGVGGYFKGKNPNVSINELALNVVSGVKVVYIGKAGSLAGKATLNSRIGQYLRFGQTKSVGHWGGRYIWQLKNHPNLIFCWKLTAHDPREIERQLLKDFVKQHHKRPFANLTG